MDLSLENVRVDAALDTRKQTAAVTTLTSFAVLIVDDVAEAGRRSLFEED